MKPASNSYELPERMKRADVRPAPPRPEPLCYAPACMLALGSVALLLGVLLPHVEPSRFWAAWYTPACHMVFIACVMGYFLAFVLSLLGVVMGWSRFRNGWVLVGCFLSLLAIACLLAVAERAGLPVG